MTITQGNIDDFLTRIDFLVDLLSYNLLTILKFRIGNAFDLVFSQTDYKHHVSVGPLINMHN